MRPSSTTVMRAGRRNTREWNYVTRGNTAGHTRIGGGTWKAAAGTVITTGTITIMITTTTIMTATVTTITSNSWIQPDDEVESAPSGRSAFRFYPCGRKTW